MKVCSKCEKEKEESEFRTRQSWCKPCERIYDHNRQINNRERYMKKKYHAMVQRTNGNGIFESNAKGKPMCSYEEFWAWYLSTKTIFERMFSVYLEQDEDRCYAPSVDRIDSKRGYEIGNLQWLTTSENSRKKDNNV